MSKTILITGSSSGIGKATAKYFQEKGWNVVATMRSPENENELTAMDNVLVMKLDVLDSVSIKRAVSTGIEKFGRIDVLLNNAGYGTFGPLEATPMEKIRRQFDVNVIGLLETTKAIIPHFRGNKDGMIINVSSMGGKIPMPLGALYHGTNFAIEGITESLIFEMEAINVKVKIIEPGIINTDFSGRSLDRNMDENLSEYLPVVEKLIANSQDPNRIRSEPIVVAEVIYQAATDGTNQLRYPAGEDAKAIIEKRKKLDDESFINVIKAQFGL